MPTNHRTSFAVQYSVLRAVELGLIQRARFPIGTQRSPMVWWSQSAQSKANLLNAESPFSESDCIIGSHSELGKFEDLLRSPSTPLSRIAGDLIKDDVEKHHIVEDQDTLFQYRSRMIPQNRLYSREDPCILLRGSTHDTIGASIDSAAAIEGDRLLARLRGLADSKTKERNKPPPSAGRRKANHNVRGRIKQDLVLAEGLSEDTLNEALLATYGKAYGGDILMKKVLRTIAQSVIAPQSFM